MYLDKMCENSLAFFSSKNVNSKYTLQIFKLFAYIYIGVHFTCSFSMYLSYPVCFSSVRRISRESRMIVVDRFMHSRRLLLLSVFKVVILE